MPVEPGQSGIEFWYDFASPYAYVAAERIARLPKADRARFVWRPFLLGAVFAHHDPDAGNRQPMNAAARANKWRDLARLCASYGIGWFGEGLRTYPPDSLRALRLALVIDDPGFVLRVFRAAFVEDRDIADPIVLASLVGATGPALREAAESEEIKRQLRRNGDMAIAAGIFGAPSFLVGEELFFGQDRLEQALGWDQSV
ncbi:MAG: 2-hydroxychromene-2-carboxylate isomerase [Minwuia sp.]|nr:2-hydroxychromene-2-carboxylate isomerase [Minwuia sp.]